MKLIVTRRVAVGGRVLFDGDSCDVNPALARMLIAARFARTDVAVPVEDPGDAQTNEGASTEAPAFEGSNGDESEEADEPESDSDAEKEDEESPSDAPAEAAGDTQTAPKKTKKRKR